MDASNLLKPALASGTLRCMGSTTYKEFRQHFEKDRALVRRFQKIDVNEPTIEDASRSCKGLKTNYEEHPQACATPPTRSARRWSCRRKYINDRKLPDKAIDVIDEAGAGAACCCRRASGGRPSPRRRSRRSSPRSPASRRRRVEGRHRGAEGPRARPEARGVRPGQGDRGAVVGDQAVPGRAARRRRSRSATTCSPGPTGVGKTEVAQAARRHARDGADPLRHVGVHGAAYASAG